MNRHISPAILRRLQDEPDSVGERERDHAAACPVCQERSRELAANAITAAAFFAATVGAEEGPVDTAPALRQLRTGEVSRVPPKPRGIDRLRIRLELGRRRAYRFGAVSGVVVLALGTLVATGVAGNLVKVFEPDNFVAFPINLTDFTSMPDLSGFGNMQVVTKPSVTTTASEASAAAASGLHLLTPTSLPSSVHGPGHYVVVSQAAGAFTFNEATAAGTVNKLGKTLPALPAGLDGSRLTLQGGPLVVETLGSQSVSPSLKALAGNAADADLVPKHASQSGGPGQAKAGVESGSGNSRAEGMLSELGGLPQLVIVQMKAPVLYSNGPTVSQYEKALLSMPGVPPQVAAEIRSLGDLSSTLPIPIPTSLASSSTADINGSPGLVIGDTTGIASGVIWQSHGLVYAVVGSLTDHQVVAIARSMH